MPVPQGLPAEVAAQLPRQRKNNFELLYTHEKLLWQAAPTADEEGSIEASGGGMTIRMMGGGDDASFIHLVEGRRTDKRSILQQEYIVGDTVQKLAWRLHPDTKEVLGVPVQKATTQRMVTRTIMTMENGQMKQEPRTDTVQITAWFAPSMPVAAGPAELAGSLPGIILEANVNNGRTVYRALEISGMVSKDAIKEPKGKKITTAEFTKERNRLMEEMRRNRGPNEVIRVN